MPIYSYTCLSCGKSLERFISITKFSHTTKYKCKCGGKLVHNLVADHKYGNVDSQMIEYHFEGSNGTRLYPCGVLPNQIDETRKKNPNTEYKFHNGCYLPVIKNRQHKLKFLKDNGFEEKD